MMKEEGVVYLVEFIYYKDSQVVFDIILDNKEDLNEYFYEHHASSETVGSVAFMIKDGTINMPRDLFNKCYMQVTKRTDMNPDGTFKENSV